MASPLFSIVTISYNQAKHLRQCIDSVLQQTFHDFEYFVVDAGSKDGSVEILKSVADPRYRWISEPDGGPSDGLNKGFRDMEGRIFCYINADDLFLPNALERAAAAFRQFPQFDVIYGDGIEIDISGKTVRRLFSNRWCKMAFAYGECNIVQQSTFFTASAFRRAGGFNIENRVTWDGELIADMALAGCKFKYVPQRFGAFRVYPESQTGSGRVEAYCRLESLRYRRKFANITTSKATAAIRSLYHLQKLILNPYASIYKAFTYPFSRPNY